MSGVEIAHEKAKQLVPIPWKGTRGEPRARVRRVAIGDPQTTFEKYLRVLDHHRLLGEDGYLAASVVSMGDHFDYLGATAEETGPEGQKCLRWLAEHDPEQVVLLAGNHDLARVMELAHQTDESFQRARASAREVEVLRKKKTRTPAEEDELARRKARFHEAFPDLATAECADRDFSGFHEAQRGLVQRLLVSRRFKLAHVARTKEGKPILLTHAGVTDRELAILGLSRGSDVEGMARALNDFLEAAVKKVAPRWERGEKVPLDMGDLHKGGRGGVEGGGLLYHRPVHPPKETEPALAPRTYDPRTLPEVLQACGHTGHKKSLKDLKGALAPSALAFLRGGLRTLTVRGGEIRYEAGIVPGDGAVLHMIDAEINYVAHDAYPILELDAAS
jgi:hypothetical protein